VRIKKFIYLFTSLTYCSIAIVMDGAAGVGAGISSIKPASSTALCVVAPKAAIRVLFCLKSGKFLYKRLNAGRAEKRDNIVKHFGQIAKIAANGTEQYRRCKVIAVLQQKRLSFFGCNV
jgi:hypothetical protein